MHAQYNIYYPCLRIGFTKEAFFTMTRTGNSKLQLDGFEYVKNKTHGDIMHWRCVKSRWSQCKGKAQTRQIGLKHMVKVYGQHNHFSDDIKTEP